MSTLPPLGAKQLDSLANSTATINVWDGSIRSGKTLVSLIRWLMFIAEAPTKGELVMVGKTRESISRNLFSAILQNPEYTGPLAAVVQYTAGAPSARILGRTVHIIGANDAKAEKVLRGLTVAGAYVDEITVIPEEFFTQLLGRMSVDGARLYGTTNPDSPAHWFKKKFLNRLHDLKGWAYFHFTMDDNPSLKPDYKARVAAEYTGLWYRRFILGEWVAADGAIYDTWDETTHVIPWANLPVMDRLLAVGVDFGTTHASAALLLGLHHDRDQYGTRTGSTLYLVDEWRYEAVEQHHRLTNAQQSASFRSWLNGKHMPAGHRDIEHVFIDSAAASFSVQLQADGVAVANADKDVTYGIGLIASLLAAGRLKVSDRCQGFITEAPGYSWDPKATERGEDAPIKVADDSLDAARYSITTTESIWRPLVGFNV